MFSVHVLDSLVPWFLESLISCISCIKSCNVVMLRAESSSSVFSPREILGIKFLLQNIHQPAHCWDFLICTFVRSKLAHTMCSRLKGHTLQYDPIAFIAYQLQFLSVMLDCFYHKILFTAKYDSTFISVTAKLTCSIFSVCCWMDVCDVMHWCSFVCCWWLAATARIPPHPPSFSVALS